MSAPSVEKLNAWIREQRAAHRWVTACSGCQRLFVQERGLRGRRAYTCGARFCRLMNRYRWRFGRAPPPETQERWRKLLPIRLQGWRAERATRLDLPGSIASGYIAEAA